MFELLAVFISKDSVFMSYETKVTSLFHDRKITLYVHFIDSLPQFFFFFLEA